MEPAVGTDTVGDALGALVARLGAAGVPEPRAVAEVLLAHVLETPRTGVIAAARRPLPAAAAPRLAALAARAIAREPVHYLVGEREFWSLPLAVDSRVFIPRPVTELVVETALRLAPGARRVLDLGTGSGAIAAALALELPTARVWASDREPGALAAARANLARHAPRVALVCGDLVAPFRAGAFDLLVANPPYVAENAYAALPPEVRDHEPRSALAGGPDGTAVLRALVAAAPAVLARGGWLVMEIGAGQAAAMQKAAERSGAYERVHVARDPAGIERVLAARVEAERRRTWIRS